MSPACRTSNAAIPPTSRRREPRSRQPAWTARQGQGRGGARTSGRYLWELHPKVACNSPRSLFETAHNRCNSNDCFSMFERLPWELHARFLGNHTDIPFQKSHAIPLGHFSRQPIIVAIPTTIFQCLKDCHGNCMRHCWETTPVVTQQRAVHQHSWHRDSAQSAALHPLRSTAPVTKRCTRSERVLAWSGFVDRVF